MCLFRKRRCRGSKLRRTDALQAMVTLRNTLRMSLESRGKLGINRSTLDSNRRCRERRLTSNTSISNYRENCPQTLNKDNWPTTMSSIISRPKSYWSMKTVLWGMSKRVPNIMTTTKSPTPIPQVIPRNKSITAIKMKTCIYL